MDDQRRDANEAREPRGVSRRKLLQAGWTVPFIVSIAPGAILVPRARASTTDNTDSSTGSDADVDAGEIIKPVRRHIDANHEDMMWHTDDAVGHGDHIQHFDRYDHQDQSHSDVVHTDNGWTHHYDAGHGDLSGHFDGTGHQDEILDVHVDITRHGDMSHMDV